MYSIGPKFNLFIISEYISRPSGYDSICVGIYVMSCMLACRYSVPLSVGCAAWKGLAFYVWIWFYFYTVRRVESQGVFLHYP